MLKLILTASIVLGVAVSDAERILATHSCKYSECPFNSDLNIPYPVMLNLPGGIRATVSSDYKWSFLSRKVKWDRDYLTLTLIHESLHSNRICGPDNKRRVVNRLKSACTINGSVLQDADDIDRYVNEHLKLNVGL